MMNIDVPVEVENMETLLEYLESEQESPCHNSFLDLHEVEILNEFDYKQVQFKKYAYAVKNKDDFF